MTKKMYNEFFDKNDWGFQRNSNEQKNSLYNYFVINT